MIEASAVQIVDATRHATVELTAADEERMAASAVTLERAVKDGCPVYGLTRGFGPLGEFAADDDSGEHGLNLINHLCAGHGPELAFGSTRLMLRLRLEGMKRGYSGVHPDRWRSLAAIYNVGFVPVVPSRGSVSASGDLVPLAHAARAFSGQGEAWVPAGQGHVRMPARQALARLRRRPVQWEARDALAFVNGSSTSLAVALENHALIRRLAWIASAITGWIVELLGASGEPYDEAVVAARGGFPGHARAAGWIRQGLTERRTAAEARSLQERYSLRCAPQVIGSVLDHLGSTEALLVREARGCTDNPVVASDAVWHAGNFHAVNVGLVADLQAVLVHQLAFLAERQIAVLVEPGANGGLPPLLAARPGATSGLAGLQLAASAMLAEIRQRSGPATTTPVPTNLSNQDIVPVALIGALRVAEQLDLAGRIVGAVAVAAGQAQQLLGHGPSSAWTSRIIRISPRLHADRPLADEVCRARDVLFAEAAESIAGTGPWP
ncbi:aromatic amino acid ammonia-lyase [Phytoactinopolyspora halotolerans]|uniref:Aromatic amino acid lyase n=1 Tax=Phytoactinopolyspora halotolerans TaxID=1981512 RepID=A0A6L9S5S7_9ACTN|nr:aromatic amino acid ammonia-lyase [Phytoactinopolyspora halotolerans]NED99851.1 aromatic amino acid lyase [Phytoactinopolyspora halotolerans]